MLPGKMQQIRDIDIKGNAVVWGGQEGMKIVCYWFDFYAWIKKLETVISRGDQNTWPRDYYDIYILTKLRAENIDLETLTFALDATAKKRGSSDIVKQYHRIMEMVRNSEAMTRQWKNYQKDFDYAAGIEFKETCDAVIRTMDSLPKR